MVSLFTCSMGNTLYYGVTKESQLVANNSLRGFALMSPISEGRLVRCKGDACKGG
jgi:hypothetical protein